MNPIHFFLNALKYVRQRVAGVGLGTVLLWSLTGCSMPELLVKQDAIPTGAVISTYDFSLHQTNVHAFDRIDVSAVVAYEQRPLKIDTLLVLFDSAGLKGQRYRQINAEVYGREIIRRMHLTIPPEARIYGEVFITKNNAGPVKIPDDFTQNYNAVYFESALNNGVGLAQLEGNTLAAAIDQLARYSVRRSGRLGIVLITSWDRMDAAAENAVIRLRQRHESIKGLNVMGMEGGAWDGRLQPGHCLHAIGVGNMHSRNRIHTPEACGSFWAGDALMQPSEMASFVIDTLYGPPLDSDGDGVPNYLDHCEKTPPGRMVTSQGCLRFPSAAERDEGQK
jgi:hypothetical protein